MRVARLRTADRLIKMDIDGYATSEVRWRQRGPVWQWSEYGVDCALVSENDTMMLEMISEATAFWT